MDVEDYKYFGLCKICLQDGCFRSLWAQFEELGMLENYGNMLNECFALNWQKPNNEELDQICDHCIARTRDAYSFRQLVLASQNQLSHSGKFSLKLEVDEAGAVVPVEFNSIIKQETHQNNYEAPESPADYQIEYLDNNLAEEYEDVEYLEQDDYSVKKRSVKLQELDFEVQDDPDDPDYVLPDSNEVEYLELGCDDEIAEESTKKQTPKAQKRKKKKNSMRTYKNYTIEDFEHSIKAVTSGLMTPLEASIRYSVPRKTIAAKLLAIKRGIAVTTKVNNSNHELIEEVRTLLTYTNMLPFKTRTAHLHCAYCSTDGPLFDEPDDLRTHTRTEHAGERTKSVEYFLRPQWLNEILKVDIENLHCTVCCTILLSWNDMFKHLKEKHNLDFDVAYTRVVPFILSNHPRCALCKNSFPNYHHLDGHMNAHYNNYMCSECGETFLTEARMKKHLKIHTTGKFVCGECGKTFTLEKYRAKHIKLVHKQEQNVKCLYCPEKFHGEYTRHQHVEECHREKVKTITCEMCGKSFGWRPYYLRHIRRKHNNEKNHKCKVCLKTFFMKSDLKRHLASHEEPANRCQVCNLSFATKWALNSHNNQVHAGAKNPGAKVVQLKVDKGLLAGKTVKIKINKDVKKKL